MTENEAKARLCVWAEQQVGYAEGANNQNRYADNKDLRRLYGWNPQNQPWCDVFVDVGFIECFGVDAAAALTYQPMGAGSALCRTSAQYYRDHGAFSMSPEIGDQVFFYSGDNINHTGIVVSVVNGTVVTVEGNSSDQVAERTYSVGDAKIAGYGRPNWSVVADKGEEGAEFHFRDGAQMVQPPQAQSTPETPSAPEPAKDARFYMLRLPYLRRGDTGEAVAAVQFELAAQGYNIGPDGADGDFGRNTEEAVKEFQLAARLSADGVVGPATGARLFGGEVAQEQAADAAVGEEEPTEEQPQEAQPLSGWEKIKAKFTGAKRRN